MLCDAVRCLPADTSSVNESGNVALLDGAAHGVPFGVARDVRVGPKVAWRTRDGIPSGASVDRLGNFARMGNPASAPSRGAVAMTAP